MEGNKDETDILFMSMMTSLQTGHHH